MIFTLYLPSLINFIYIKRKIRLLNHLQEAQKVLEMLEWLKATDLAKTFDGFCYQILSGF